MLETIPYFWIAFYNDNTCLPQFDLDTGEQHLFKDIDQIKLAKFGWFPVTYELQSKLGKPFYVNPKLNSIILELKPNQRLIALREESQSRFTYSHCTKCGFNWQWIPNREEGSIGDSGLPRYNKYYTKTASNGRVIAEVICPQCLAKNDLKCPDCDEWWNKVNDDGTLECPKCKKIYERRTFTSAGLRYVCRWLLGYQETLPDGHNEKHIMSIDKDGIIQLGSGR